MRHCACVVLAASWLAIGLAGCEESEHPVSRTGSGLPHGARAGIDLQRVGTIADYPDGDGRVVVNVDASGTISVEDEVRDLPQLKEVLRARADGSRSADVPHASSVDVVLRLDRSLPWGVAQWILLTCADPGVGMWRVHFAVRPEGEGREGTMDTFLPRDGGLARTPMKIEERARMTARIRAGTDDEGSDPALLYARVRELLAPDPTLPAEVDADPMVPVGFVLRVVDAFQRAGAREVVFVGAPPPSGSGSIAALIERARAVRGVPGIWLFDEKLGPRAPAAMPPVARGARTPAEPRPWEELFSPPPIVDIPPIDMEEKPIEDPVVRDAPAGEEEPEEGDDIYSDAPFDGPSTGAAIGIGGNARAAFGGRGGRRNLRAEGGGGTQGAVDLGLEWLANHQDPEGSWDCDGFEARCKLDRCGGAGVALYDRGVTGLALLAFLGVGETHKTVQYRKTVKRGLRYLKQAQDPEGCFGPRTTNRFTYNHGCATLAMVEAYALTGSPLWKASAQAGIDFIEKCRNPDLAWRYGVRPQNNDTSVTGWMVMALKSAKEAGNLRVPEEAFEGAKNWLDKVTEPESGKVGYTARGTGPARPIDVMEKFPPDRSESLTTVGILVRTFLGENPRDSETIRKGVALCMKVLPEWDEDGGSIDMYYWYYGSLALFQVGGEPWKSWNTAMKAAIVDHQRKDGDQRGSWDPMGPWGREGGRVYSTAVCVMCLEVYYRYARVFGTRR